MSPHPTLKVNRLQLLKEYWEIPAAIFFSILGYYLHNFIFVTIACGVAISIIAILVAEISEAISDRIPQPFDSMILTLSAVGVEILLLFMLLKAGVTADSADIAKSSIVSAVLVDINLLFGLSLFIGGIVWKQQKHNEDSSESYTLILLVTAFVLLIPSLLKFTTGTSAAVFSSSFLVSILLFTFYLIILIFQTKTHVHFFKDISKRKILRKKKVEEEEDIGIFDTFPMSINAVLLFFSLGLVGIIAEKFSHAGMELVSDMGIPLGIAGIAVAMISVFPELFTAIKAARNNEIQKVVNIALGASVVTILITVPVLMVLSYLKGIKFDLTLNPLQIITFFFTILIVWKSTNDGETDYLKGITHIILFIAYIIMIGLS